MRKEKWRVRKGKEKRQEEGERKEKGEMKGKSFTSSHHFASLQIEKRVAERINHRYILHCFSFRAVLPGNWVETILSVL